MGWTAAARMVRGLRRTPADRAQAGGAQPEEDDTRFALVRRATTLQDIARVERHLPEILGRALARGWIDRPFSAALMADPKGLVARYGVFLPDSVRITVETTATQRQRIVVHEIRPDGTARRLMYLQLVMMAGK